MFNGSLLETWVRSKTMKTATLLGGTLSLFLLLATASGCYTQVGTTDDLYSGEYGRGTPGEEGV